MASVSIGLSARLDFGGSPSKSFSFTTPSNGVFKNGVFLASGFASLVLGDSSSFFVIIRLLGEADVSVTSNGHPISTLSAASPFCVVTGLSAIELTPESDVLVEYWSIGL